MIYLIKVLVFTESEIILGDGARDLTKIKPFEKDLSEDFPVSNELNYHKHSRIPKTIHQTWKYDQVPSVFHDNVRSFIEFNSDYDYYYWTDKSARELIEERHNDLLETFDNYVEPVRKADMLRYVVLYEIGGIYADLDTTCLRNLDRVLNKYSCILSPEPFEHSSLIFNANFMVTNSIMFCQAGHPFLKKLMDNLPDFSHFSQDIDATGPNYVTLHLNQYMRDFKSRDLPDTHAHSVTVPLSKYFQNEIDPIRFDDFRKMCKEFETLNNIGKRGCVTLLRNGMIHRKQSSLTFTQHAFYHTGYKILSDSRVNIKQLVPHARIYSR
ncbi:hypothetical protein ACF0H5_011209 [Mactra antiquata]